jgi:hypothetical protein
MSAEHVQKALGHAASGKEAGASGAVDVEKRRGAVLLLSTQ